jgi:hypothetical protein
LPVFQVPYPAYSGGVVLTSTHLIGSAGGFPDSFFVVARRLDELLAGVGEDALLSETGFATAANSRWAFIRTSQYTAEPFRSKLLAKSVEDFGDPSPETLRVVAGFESNTSIIRTEAASERYLVWQDHAPYDGSTWDTWKVYARSMDELFTPGAERLVVDTGLGGAGAYLDLAGSLLVVQVTDPDCGRERGRSQVCRILLVDLDRPDAEPVTVIETDDPDVHFKWPSVSSDYVVWTEMQGFFVRTAYGRRLVDGRPAGAPFAIGPGGSWIMIDRNIAVWNGSTTFGEGEVIHGAIMAAELALPGAEDVGDVDGDGSIVLTDAVVVLNYLFQGGWRPRLRLADANLSGTIDLGDAVRILEYLFLGGRGGRRPGT